MGKKKREAHSLDGQCPLGPEGCPIFEGVNELRRERDQLRELSHIDPLTGLRNFRYLMSALELELERSRRTHLPTAIIMIDLDHFKKINDKFGHPAGNAVLKFVSQLWVKNIRKIDTACRYGGEEFAIIVPGSGAKHAMFVAERLRASLERKVLKYRQHRLGLTASFGVDVFEPGEEIDAEGLIARADRYLLEAKAEGRNAVRGCRPTRGGVSRDEKAALDFL